VTEKFLMVYTHDTFQLLRSPGQVLQSQVVVVQVLETTHVVPHAVKISLS